MFASDRFDFAMLFTVKTRAVSHISAGSTPYVLVIDSDNFISRAAHGQVIVVDGRGFSPAVVEGIDAGKWWSDSPVRVLSGRSISIGGSQHLISLGVQIFHLGPRAAGNRIVAQDAARVLKAQRSRAEFWSAVEHLVASGELKTDGGHRWTSDGLKRSLAEPSMPIPQCSREFDESLSRYFDSIVSARMELRIRTRLIHGVDHASRTAVLCRILSNLLVQHRVAERLSNLDLIALMVAGFLHDSARQRDTGPDNSALESALYVGDEMRSLGFPASHVETAKARLRHDGTGSDPTNDLGAAIIQTADAFELMRSYSGDIHLSSTQVYPLLRPRGSAAIEAYVGIAQSYAAWLKSMKAWGLAQGRVCGPHGRVLLRSMGAEFDPIAVFGRSVSTAPFSAMRATLRTNPRLNHFYEGISREDT